MSPPDLIQTTNAALDRAEARGLSRVSIASLRALLTHLARANAEANAELIPYNVRLLQYEKQLSAWVSAQEADAAERLELFRSVISSGQAAIKALILINGGAAVAMLAFLGQLSLRSPAIPLGPFYSSLIFFCYGLGCAGAAAGATYFSQSAYLAERSRLGNALRLLAAAFGLASLSVFVWASIEAAARFAASAS
jgi:hypothetical protein